MRVRFATCAFDPDTREVTRGGSAVLSAGVLDLLRALFEKRPRAVSPQVGDIQEPPSVSGPTPLRPRFLLCGEREIPLRDGETLVGRHESCAVRLDFREVSRRHARIRVTGARAILEDLSSCNGTFLNGMRVEEPAEIEVGDQIRIGSARLRVLEG